MAPIFVSYNILILSYPRWGRAFHMLGYENVEPLELQALLRSEAVLLVDVRTPTESARGGIPGARNIPLHLLPLRKQELPDDQTVVFYCQSGNRSAQACAFMISQGRRRVVNLQGGILAWLQCGQPVSTGFLN